MRASTTVLLLVQLTIATFAFSQSSATIDSLRAIDARITATNNDAAQLRALADDLVYEATALLQKKAAGSSQLLVEAHQLYIRAGERKSALQLMSQLVTSGESASWKAYGSLRRGDLLSPDDPMQAALAYEQSLKTIDSQDPQWPYTNNETNMLRLALLGAARCRIAANDCKAALPHLNRLVNDTQLVREPLTQMEDTLELARAHWKCGDSAEGDSLFESTLQEAQPLLAQDGTLVHLRLEANRRSTSQPSFASDREANFMSDFAAPSLRAMPEFAFVIAQGSCSKFATDQAYVAWTRQVLQLIDNWRATTLLTAPQERRSSSSNALLAAMTQIVASPTTRSACDVRIGFATRFLQWFPEETDLKPQMVLALQDCGAQVP